MLENIVYIAITLLLPIIPAFLLYKTLPSTATVSGPFKGLNIQLSGAFGGYFLLVVLVITFVDTRPKPAKTEADTFKYDVYRVEGRINLEDTSPTLNKTDLENISLSLQPPERLVKPDGTFVFEIPVKHGQFGQADFPDLLIEHPAYEPATIHLVGEESKLNPPGYQINLDQSNKHITVGSTIRLKRVDKSPAYSVARTIPKPVELPAEDK